MKTYRYPLLIAYSASFFRPAACMGLGSEDGDI
jgi:hypothetical protein